MFRTKSRTEKVKDAAADRADQVGGAAAAAKDRAVEAASHAASAARDTAAEWAPVAKEKASTAAQVAADRTAGARSKAAAGAGALAVTVLGALRDAFDNKVAPHTGAVGEKVAEKTVAARDRAVAGIDHGIDVAVPKSQEAVAGVAPVVDHARDLINDEVLPRIQELLGHVQTAKDDLLAKQDGPIAAVTGAPKKKKRKGGTLIALGLLAAAGAGVAYYLNQQQNKPKDDPWAQRPIGGAAGVDSQVRQTLAAQDGASAAEAAADADAVMAGTDSSSSVRTESTPTYDRVASASAAGTGAAAAAATAGSADRVTSEESPMSDQFDDSTESTDSTDGTWTSDGDSTADVAGSASTDSADGNWSTDGDSTNSDAWTSGADTADSLSGDATDAGDGSDGAGVHILTSDEIDEMATTTPVSAPIDESVEPSGAEAAAQRAEGGDASLGDGSEEDYTGDSALGQTARDGDTIDSADEAEDVADASHDDGFLDRTEDKIDETVDRDGH